MTTAIRTGWEGSHSFNTYYYFNFIKEIDSIDIKREKTNKQTNKIPLHNFFVQSQRRKNNPTSEKCKLINNNIILIILILICYEKYSVNKYFIITQVVDATDERILTVITYIGCSVSIVGVFLTIITFLSLPWVQTTVFVLLLFSSKIR